MEMLILFNNKRSINYLFIVQVNTLIKFTIYTCIIQILSNKDLNSISAITVPFLFNNWIFKINAKIFQYKCNISAEF